MTRQGHTTSLDEYQETGVEGIAIPIHNRADGKLYTKVVPDALVCGRRRNKTKQNWSAVIQNSVSLA